MTWVKFNTVSERENFEKMMDVVSSFAYNYDPCAQNYGNHGPNL
jgi:hypothetical protein